MVEFLNVEEILGFSPELTILKASSQFYKALLYQHTGKLTATSTKIGNADDVSNRLDAFFKLADTSKADLVLTPEYCCPINILQGILDDPKRWPGKGRLWLIGGESISLTELKAFQSKYEDLKRSVHVYFDEEVLEKNNKFLCPLFYIFKEAKILHVVVQFKVTHCGVWNGENIERDNIILGDTIYVFGVNHEIRLFSLICADAMIFSTIERPKWMSWKESPYLILNPQLNPEPKHSLFIDFRKSVMNFDNKEIITLNWNANSKGLHGDLMHCGHSRSGLVINSKEIELEKTETLVQNHKRGLTYFKFDAPDRHAFFCNGLVDAFLIQVLPVRIENVTRPQMKKDAPEVEACYLFSSQLELTAHSDVVTDNFIDFLQQNKCYNSFLNNPNTCILEKERLVTLSAGEIKKGDLKWYELHRLFSIRLEESYEINNRLTLFEDKDKYSKWQRKKFLRAVKKLDGILKNAKNLPESMAALKDRNLFIGYSQVVNQGKDNGYKFNVVDEEGNEVVATVCYLDDGDIGDAMMTFDTLQCIVGNGGERGRVVVFYDDEGEVASMCDHDYAKITNPNSSTAGSIIK